MNTKNTIYFPGKGSIEKRGSWFVALSESGEVLCSTKSYFKTLSSAFGISGKEANDLTQELLLKRG